MVRLEVLGSSLLLALVFLPLLAWKWRVSMRTALLAAMPLGLLAGVIAGLVDSWAGGLSWLMLAAVEFCGIAGLMVMAIMARFYRDPERRPPEMHNVILSPADGTVVYVNGVEGGSSLVSTKGERQFRLDEIAASNLLSDAAYLIGIDMNVLNVHVNRSPIAGQVLLLKRTEGKFISLRRQEAETMNERVTTVIGDGPMRVAVVQIASRLVRRIVSRVRQGDILEPGQRIGAIVFGSQVDVAIPVLDKLRVEVRRGDKVRAGESVIARYG